MPMPKLGRFAQLRRCDLVDFIARRFERLAGGDDRRAHLRHHVVERGGRDRGAQRTRWRGPDEWRRDPIGIARIAHRHGGEGEAQVRDGSGEGALHRHELRRNRPFGG